MSYQVTARKWRPMVFEDVIGQAHVCSTLRNALATDRLAHAFVFSGGRGCGKTTTARILAKAVNCLHPRDFNPCNECEVCDEITNGRSLDVIEIDGASNRGVDEIRNLRESVRYAPARGKYKVYIIDEVHMLTKEAFNALLKTLEEPPPHVLFIFATTEVHKVPATILSRCQRYDFRRITVEDIISRLRFIAREERITIDDDSLLVIAKKGDGSMRDAQSIFDQVVSYCGTTIKAPDIISVLNLVDQEFFFRISECIANHDTKGGLALVEEIVRNGYDIKEFLSGLGEHFRNLLIARATGSVHLIEASETYRKRYAHDASYFGEHDILRLIKLTTDLETSMRFSAQPRFRLEVGIVQMTKMEQSVKIDDLLEQLDELKKKLNPESDGSTAPLHSSFVAPTNGVQSSAAAHADGILGDPVTLEKLRQEWSNIVQDIRRKKISVGTILGESAPVSVADRTLQIACTDDFHVSSLKRNQTFLTEAINTLLGTKLRVEAVLHSPASSGQGLTAKATASSPVPKSTPTSEERTTPPGKLHHLIEALYRDFGAERI